MQIIRNFSPADRYQYDFKTCTYEKGWAQIDTSQDASYFGQWINPKKLQIFAYIEGDLILTKCDSAAELVEQISQMKAWNVEQGHRFLGIDPGFGKEMLDCLKAVGLGEFLHGVPKEQ